MSSATQSSRKSWRRTIIVLTGAWLVACTLWHGLTESFRYARAAEPAQDRCIAQDGSAEFCRQVYKAGDDPFGVTVFWLEGLAAAAILALAAWALGSMALAIVRRTRRAEVKAEAPIIGSS